MLVDQFASIVIALLAVAAAVAWATGDNAEAIAILIVLVLNAAVGFATEWQAGRALDALRRQSHTHSRVRRDGFESTVDAEELVPGDIVILNSGDRVPADTRLLEALRLETEESALTGEVSKYAFLPLRNSCEALNLDSKDDHLCWSGVDCDG